MINRFILKKTVLNRNFEFEFKKGSYLIKGPNGAGKTTILSSLHPFDTFLAKNISIRDLLEPGGIKEIELTHFTDKYVVRIRKRKGSDEFFIQKNGKKLLLTTSVTTFRKTINNIFDPNFFLFSQLHSNLKNLSEIQNASIKQMFLTLSSGALFEKIRQIIKDKLKNLSTKYENIEYQLKGLSKNVDQFEIEHTKEELETLIKKLENKLITVKEMITELEQKKKEHILLEQKMNKIIIDISVLESKLKSVDEQKAHLKNSKEKVKDYKKNLIMLEKLEDAHDELFAKERKELSKIDDQLNDVKLQLYKLKEQLKKAEKYKNLPCSKNIRTNCPLVPENLPNIKELEKEKQQLEETQATLLEEKQTIKTKYADKKHTLDLQITELSNTVKEQEKLIEYIKYTEKDLKEYEENKQKLIEKQKLLSQIQSNIKQLDFDSDVLLSLNEKKFKIKNKLDKYQQELKIIKILSTTEDEKETLKRKQEALLYKQEIFNQLQKIFAINGFPAVELMSVLENVNTITNQLFNLYKPDLQLQASINNDARQSINLTIINKGIPLKLESLSSGEQAWADKFIRLSLAFIARQSHGYIDYLTCDEGEGAISNEDRELFLKAHHDILSRFDFNQIFVISHDPRAENLFDYTIEL